MGSDEIVIRPAQPGDAAVAARLLHDFNAEFDEPTPGVAALAERLEELLGDGTLELLLAGQGPEGFAQFRFLRGVWGNGLGVYLEELYVVPERRGEGIGRALLEATMEAARAGGADHIDLNTGETDSAARALYESAGFTNREGGPEGPSMLYYERDL